MTKKLTKEEHEAFQRSLRGSVKIMPTKFLVSLDWVGGRDPHNDVQSLLSHISALEQEHAQEVARLRNEIEDLKERIVGMEEKANDAI